MSHPNSSFLTPLSPQANLRVSFWGVQGSCPIFPTQDEVNDYAQMITTLAVQRALADIAGRLEQGKCDPAMLRELAKPDNAAEYQREIGVPHLPVYGGDTTCIEVNNRDGDIILFDLGTGIRDFSRRAVARPEPSNHLLHIFLSHEHLDHRNGLSFASFCFEKAHPYTVHLYGTRRVLAALDDRYGIFSHKITPAMHVDDPLDYRFMSATFSGTEIRTSSSPISPEGGLNWSVWQVNHPINIGQTTVTPFEVYHGDTQCLAYQVRHKNSTFVFCTDHEVRHGPDPEDPRQIRSMEAERRLVERCRNAQVAYFDGQYFLCEYTGATGIGSSPGVPRLDWGHSCIEDDVARAEQCNIGHTFIGHHDPERPWGERLEVDRNLEALCRGKPYHIELAKAGHVVEL